MSSTKLRANSFQFISDPENQVEGEFDSVVFELPSVIFRQALALAEVVNSDFKAPGGTHYFGGDCALLESGLTTWFEAQEHIESPLRQSGMKPIHHLTSFFRVPANQSWLKKFTKFVSLSRGFLIQEGL